MYFTKIKHNKTQYDAINYNNMLTRATIQCNLMINQAI